MKVVYAILKREIMCYFASPLAYIILVVFLTLSGIFFFTYLNGFLQSQYDPRFQLYGEKLNLNDFVIAPYLSTINILLLLLVPLITMRLIAEERRHFTGEMLFTSPIRPIQIIMGKYLASFALFVVMMALSYINVLVLQLFGNPDPGPILSGYLGLILVGASFISVGLFASSLTDNQIVSAIISFGILLLFWIVGASSDPNTSPLGYVSIINHFEGFTKGIVDLKDVVYYLTFAFYGIFLTHTFLESERWR